MRLAEITAMIHRHSGVNHELGRRRCLHSETRLEEGAVSAKIEIAAHQRHLILVIRNPDWILEPHGHLLFDLCLSPCRLPGIAH
jgi:hypothetical protein